MHECVWECVSKCDRLVAADVTTRDVQLANSNKESRGQARKRLGSMEDPGESTCTYWLTLLQEHPSILRVKHSSGKHACTFFLVPMKPKNVPIKVTESPTLSVLVQTRRKLVYLVTETLQYCRIYMKTNHWQQQRKAFVKPCNIIFQTKKYDE